MKKYIVHDITIEKDYELEACSEMHAFEKYKKLYNDQAESEDFEIYEYDKDLKERFEKAFNEYFDSSEQMSVEYEQDLYKAIGVLTMKKDDARLMLEEFIQEQKNEKI
jgi:hypothetical protein